MRKKITGEEAAIALLKGETVFCGTEAWRWSNGQLARRGYAPPVYWVGLAGRNINEVLNWTDCEVEVPDEPVKPVAPPHVTCPVCGAAITKGKRDWNSGLRATETVSGVSLERVGPDELTVAAHCDSCGADIVTRAEYFPKSDRPKLPKS